MSPKNGVPRRSARTHGERTKCDRAFKWLRHNRLNARWRFVRCAVKLLRHNGLNARTDPLSLLKRERERE
jgi:hypothetical protein